jgi:hypothetical protein
MHSFPLPLLSAPPLLLDKPRRLRLRVSCSLLVLPEGTKALVVAATHAVHHKYCNGPGATKVVADDLKTFTLSPCYDNVRTNSLGDGKNFIVGKVI